MPSYSIYNAPDRVTLHEIKGDVEEVERSSGRTFVTVDEGVNTVEYELDEALINFGGCLERKLYGKAIDILEELPLTPETEAMWRSLAEVAFHDYTALAVVERCYAVLGDVSKARYIGKVQELIDEKLTEVESEMLAARNGVDGGAVDASKRDGGEEDGHDKDKEDGENSHNKTDSAKDSKDGFELIQQLDPQQRQLAVHTACNHFLVHAKMAMLNKSFGRAEAILLDAGHLEAAMGMYQELHKYDESIRLAEKKNHPNVGALKQHYLQWLLSTQQEERAGELQERNGDYVKAIELYLSAGMAAKAFQVVQRYDRSGGMGPPGGVGRGAIAGQSSQFSDPQDCLSPAPIRDQALLVLDQETFPKATPWVYSHSRVAEDRTLHSHTRSSYGGPSNPRVGSQFA